MIYGSVTRQGYYPDKKDRCELLISRKSSNKLPHEQGKKKIIKLTIGNICYDAGVHETKDGQVWISSVLTNTGLQKEDVRLVDALEDVGLKWCDKIKIKKVGREYQLQSKDGPRTIRFEEPLLKEIQKRIIAFRDQRDWAQFHDPKNLAEAISIEAGELLEIFLWKTIDQSKNLSDEELTNLKHEIADIFIFLTYLCEEYKIDLLKDVESKIFHNELKYPVAKSKGSSKKYTDL